jgi:tape measure domain-containing protein
MIVRELITRLGFNVDNSSLDRADGRLRRIRGEAESAANAFAAIGAAIAGFAAARGLVAIADEMQSIRARIEALPQTIGDAAAAFDVVADHASETGLAIEAYASLYTRVGNAAKDYVTTQQDLLQVTDTLGKALVVGGASAQEASATMQQFAQALASGVLQGDEFRSMAEAAPQYLDRLAEEMKIPREQLKKMASDGKLTSREVIAATQRMADYFDERFRNMPMTVGRAMTVVSNRFSKMIDRMNRESDVITMMAGFIVDAMDAVENGINKVIEVVGGADNAVRLMIATLAALALMAGVALAPMIAAGIEFVAVAALIALALEDVFTWLQGGDSLIGAMIGPWSQWKDNVLGTFDAIIDVGKSLWNILESLWKGDPAALIDGVAKFFTSMRALGDNLAPILLAALSALWDGLKNIASAIMRALITAFVAALQALIDGGVAAAGTIGDALLNAIKGAGSGIWDFFTGGGPKVAPSQMTAQGMGNSAVNQTNNTNVTVQVPAGTNAEQKAHIERSAKAAFSAVQPANPRDLAAHGR